jgi:hypothetical protein
MNPDCEPLIQIVLLPCLVATLLFAQINIPSHISLWGVNIFGYASAAICCPEFGTSIWLELE